MTYEAPQVVVHDVHEYSTPQPAYPVLPRLPMRAISVAQRNGENRLHCQSYR